MIDVLDAVEASGARVVHAATPGPMGIAGLVVARTLGLPFVASHNTELARYALELTGDRLAAQLADRALRWFYGQAGRVYVPTRAAAEGIVAAGVAPARVHTFSRGTDRERFDPERRSRSMRRRLGAPRGTILLYVGRLSREKGLGALAEAFRRVSASRPELHLAIVGDGPARREVARSLAGTRHRMVGPLRGDDLATAYASADIFCLPSETETFGQVVTEAAASGLPAIVVDRGGAAEQVEHGVTGLVAPAGDVTALAGAIALIHDVPAMREAMGAAALTTARSRPTWDEVFTELAGGYRGLVDDDDLSAPASAPAARPAA